MICFGTLSASAQHPTADGAGQTFNTLSEQYFQQVYFKYAPTAGTSAGLHQYDALLEDYSAAEVQKQIAALHEWEKKVAAIDPSALDAEPAADRDILLNSIRAQLLQLEVIRGWEKNPDNYSTGVTSSIFTIMERPYAPVDVRLRAAVEREKLIRRSSPRRVRTSRILRVSIPRSHSSRSTTTSASSRTMSRRPSPQRMTRRSKPSL
jgi:uncharacterized protein (DUF885 family)